MLDLLTRYLGTLGAGGIFIAVFIESLGVPFPGGIMVILAGFLAGQGRIPLILVFAATIAGFTLGASTAFYLGRNIGEPAIERYGRYLHITPRTFEKAQAWMQQSSAVFILVGRFIPMISNLTPFMAGLSGLSWTRFLFYNTVFVFIWSAFYIALGLFFGHNWQRITAENQTRVPVIALAVLLAYLMLRYLVTKRKKAANPH